MKPKSILLELNLNAFSRFVKLSSNDKIKELKSKAILVDTDMDQDTAVNLYFLNGFFVEEVVSKKDNKTIEIIPYRHGYKPEAFVEVVEMVVPKRRMALVA